MVLYRKAVNLMLKIRFCLLIVLYLLTQQVSVAFAADGEKQLQDVFNTVAFSGNWELFSKVNFIGLIMNYTISFFCLIGLFLTCMQMMMTLLYKSNQSFFDYVHELKTKGSAAGDGWSNALGLKGLFTGAFKEGGTRKATGLDSVLAFVISLLPDIYLYSEYYSESGDLQHGLKKEDSMMTYLFHVSASKLLTIFALSMGFNGKLWQAYGTIVDGMGAAASQFVDLQLADYVNDFFKTGSKHKFYFDASGTSFGKLQQTVAKSMYGSILGRLPTSDLDSDSIKEIGSQLETFVMNNFTDLVLTNALGVTIEDSPLNKAASDVDFSCTVIKSTSMPTVTPNSSKVTSVDASKEAGNTTYTASTSSNNKTATSWRVSYKLSDLIGKANLTSGSGTLDLDGYIVTCYFDRASTMTYNWWKTTETNPITDGTNRNTGPSNTTQGQASGKQDD